MPCALLPDGTPGHIRYATSSQRIHPSSERQSTHHHCWPMKLFHLLVQKLLYQSTARKTQVLNAFAKIA
jgi:hypothetical protein